MKTSSFLVCASFFSGKSNATGARYTRISSSVCVLGGSPVCDRNSMTWSVHRIAWIILIVVLLSLNVTYAAFQMGLLLSFTDDDETMSYMACEGDSTEQQPIASIVISDQSEATGDRGARGDCHCLVSLYNEDTVLSPGAGVTVQTVQDGKYTERLNYNATGRLAEGLTFQSVHNVPVPTLSFEGQRLSLADDKCAIIATGNASLKLKCQQSPFQASIFTTTESFVVTKATTRRANHVTDKSGDLETSLATKLSTVQSLATDLRTEKSKGQSVSLILILLICGSVIVFMLCIAVIVVIVVCLKKRNRQNERNNVETVNTGPGPTYVSVPNDDTNPGTEYAQVNLSLLKPKAKPDVQDDATSPPLVYADLAFDSGQQGDAESATNTATNPSNGESDVAALYSKPIKRQKTKI